MHKLIKVPERGMSMRGRVAVRGYHAGTLEQVEPLALLFRRFQRLLRDKENTSGLILETSQQRMRELLLKIDAIFEKNALGPAIVQDNLIMTGTLTGRDLLVQYLLPGGTYYTTGINYGAIGTSSTAPASSDTQLGAEVARITSSVANDVSNNELQLQFYFPDANLTNGTYKEVGTFMNGSASANSGQIFNHALLGTPYTKGSGTDTTLEIDITFT